MPTRIQRRRDKGWRKPEGAVYVGRGSRWGNPYRVVREGGYAWVEGSSWVEPVPKHIVYVGHSENAQYVQQEAVDRYRAWIASEDSRELRRELAGRDLMCWCPIDQPCHADVLLELANGQTS